MTKLSYEEYKEAEGILKRYKYNCVNIIELENSITGAKATNIDGMPKAKNSTSDIVYRQYNELQENTELKKYKNEKRIVDNALNLLDKIHKDILEKYYIQKKNKYEVMNILYLSEATWKRRKQELIYTVFEEEKKIIKK